MQRVSSPEQLIASVRDGEAVQLVLTQRGEFFRFDGFSEPGVPAFAPMNTRSSAVLSASEVMHNGNAVLIWGSKSTDLDLTALF